MFSFLYIPLQLTLWRQVLSVQMNPLGEEKATCCEKVEKWFSRVTQLRMKITGELLHGWTKSHYPWVDLHYCILCSEEAHSVKAIIDHSFRHSGQRRSFLTWPQIKAKLTFTLNINCEYRSSVIRYPRYSEQMVSDTFTIKCILILSQWIKSHIYISENIQLINIWKHHRSTEAKEIRFEIHFTRLSYPYLYHLLNYI